MAPLSRSIFFFAKTWICSISLPTVCRIWWCVRAAFLDLYSIGRFDQNGGFEREKKWIIDHCPVIVPRRGCRRKVKRICIISITCYSLINSTFFLFQFRWIMKQKSPETLPEWLLLFFELSLLLYSVLNETRDAKVPKCRMPWMAVKAMCGYCLCSVQSPQLCSKHWICT